MTLGYNTNGFAHHRLADALEIIAELGYGGVALTPDVHHLDPYTTDFDSWLTWANGLLLKSGLSIVIETGARFILDPRRKHQPTLLSPVPDERTARSVYLLKCIDLAAALGAGVVSLWSGTPAHADSPAANMNRLVERCQRLAEAAARRHVRLAFEPEPGMFIDTMPKFEELHARVNHPAFGLTFDVGHLVCTGELPIGDHIRRWRSWLWNVHLDDMRPGVHDHLMFGEGEVDFADVFAALREIEYQGMASVELSRHSHDAVATARRSMDFLRPFTTSWSPSPRPTSAG